MIDLIAMRPSEWKDMPFKLSNEDFRSQLRKALSHFLKSSKNDGGSGADEIYITSLKLTNAGLWEHFKAKQAAEILENVSVGVRHVFLDATPDDIRLEIQQELNSLDTHRMKLRKKMSQSRFAIPRDSLTGAVVKQIPKTKRIKNG